MRGLKWRPIDQLLKGQPFEYLDVAVSGQDMSDRTFLVLQAERLIKSPRLAREDRERIERVWLAPPVEAEPEPAFTFPDRRMVHA